MPLLFFIKDEVCLCLERSGFVQSRHDEAEVVNDGFLFRVQDTSASYLVFEPHGKNFDGNMAVRIACHFSDKG